MIGQRDQEAHQDAESDHHRGAPPSYPTPMRLVLSDAAAESGEEVDTGLVVVGLVQRFGDTSLEAHQLAARTMERTAMPRCQWVLTELGEIANVSAICFSVRSM